MLEFGTLYGLKSANLKCRKRSKALDTKNQLFRIKNRIYQKLKKTKIWVQLFEKERERERERERETEASSSLMLIRDAAEASCKNGVSEEAEDRRGQDLRSEKQE